VKLAILVVYYLPDKALSVLDLHLKQLEALTKGDFEILAAAPRVSNVVRQRLQACGNLRLLELEPTSASGSKEHCHYLDQLAAHAFANGADRICTMDPDAFPIVRGWNDRIEQTLQVQQVPVVAVLRAENDDTHLPHPCCCYVTREFYAAHGPRFYAPDDALTHEPYKRFLAETCQRPDSGIGIGFSLWFTETKWAPLTRSNAVNDHFLLAGIYGDLVFHLGALSWIDRDFRKDRNSRLALRLLDWIEAACKARGLFSGRVRSLWMRVNHRANQQLVKDTNRIFSEALRRLIDDPTGYIEHLRGSASPRQTR
jgi:hypothetical protein